MSTNTSPIVSHTRRNGESYAVHQDGSETLVYKSLATAEPVAQSDETYPGEGDDTDPTAEIVTRLLGPIPAGIDIDPDDENNTWQHPGGPRPAWGGYAPIATYAEGEAALRERRPDVVLLLAGDLRGTYWAHTSGTVLIERGGSWYILCPERPCRRAVVIACDALREGRRDALASLIGLRSDEAAVAQKLHAQGMGGRVYAATLPWDPVQDVAPAEAVEDVEIIQRGDDAQRAALDARNSARMAGLDEAEQEAE